MIIGERLRELRESKNLSQGDVERRTGLLRCYISRVENGHTVPSIETLERCAMALEVPVYKLFYEGHEPPKAPNLRWKTDANSLREMKPKELRELKQFAKALSRMDDRQRRFLLAIVGFMARPKR